MNCFRCVQGRQCNKIDFCQGFVVVQRQNLVSSSFVVQRWRSSSVVVQRSENCRSTTRALVSFEFHCDVQQQQSSFRVPLVTFNDGKGHFRVLVSFSMGSFLLLLFFFLEVQRHPIFVFRVPMAFNQRSLLLFSEFHDRSSCCHSITTKMALVSLSSKDEKRAFSFFFEFPCFAVQPQHKRVSSLNFDVGSSRGAR